MIAAKANPIRAIFLTISGLEDFERLLGDLGRLFSIFSCFFSYLIINTAENYNMGFV
jgi:hypothetical protein